MTKKKSLKFIKRDIIVILYFFKKNISFYYNFGSSVAHTQAFAGLVTGIENNAWPINDPSKLLEKCLARNSDSFSFTPESLFGRR